MDRPLFYRTVVPLDRDAHRALRLAETPRYAYAAASHLLPAVMDEFPAACAELPILFSPGLPGSDTAGASPVFLTGPAPGRNALVRADGGWAAGYVPAYLRRHPFILGEVEGAEPLVCFDEGAEALRPGADVAAAPLFDAEGQATERLTGLIALVTDYAAAARRTVAASRTLLDLGLLQPITIHSAGDGAGGAASALHGLLAVDEARLNALPDAALLRLRAEGLLGAVYTHLVSLRAIGRLPG